MDRRQRAEAAVARCLEGEEAGWASAIEVACAREPDIAAEIRAIFAALGRAGFATPSIPRRVGMFDLIGALGEGGMGDVFRAMDTQLGREVAVKVVRSDVRFQPDSVERFEREMRTIAGLRHPGIVRLLSTGIDEGVPYYVMELVDGLTLAEVMRRLRGSEPGRLTGGDLSGALGIDRDVFPGAWVETCFRIVAKVAHALHHAHGAGVLHRDIKPANIMITRTGEPMLIDFGLAKQARDLQLTREGARLGSLPYLAPELWKAPNSHDVRTEVYSLGLVLWEMLTLRPAYVGESEEALRSTVLFGSLPQVRALQPALSRDAEIVCTSAIDPDPARRHADCGAFASDLEAVLALRPIAARSRGPIGRLVLLARRRPVPAALVGLCLVLVGLLATVQSIRTKSQTAAHDFSMRDRRMSAEWAIDALTFLQRMGEQSTFPLRPASKPYLDLWRAQAQEVLAYLLEAEARGSAEASRYLRPMPGLQPAENGASFFVPFDRDLDRDHAAFLTERSATIAIRTLQRALAGDDRFARIAESIARDSVESAEAKAAWRAAAEQAAASTLYSGLKLRPQFGFLPIGIDEVTRRLLFWHVAIGTRPDVRAGRESHLDAGAGLVFELMPAAEGIERAFLLARQPMSCALWGVIGFGVPDARLRDPAPVAHVSLNDCRMVLPRLALRLPTPAEWRSRYGRSVRPAGILEWTAADAKAESGVALVPEEDPVALAHNATDLANTTLAAPYVGVRAACDIRLGDEPVVEAERVFTASDFRGWTCGATGGRDSGAAWILRDGGGNPGACLESVTFSGHAFLLCLHPEAVWDPARDGEWTEIDLSIECSSRSIYGLGETVMPIVQQGDVIYFGYDPGLRSGSVRAWHAVGVSEFGAKDFLQLVPRDWQRDPTFLYRGDRVGPEMGPTAKPMRFGFGVYARMTGVYRQLFDNFRLTVRRRR